MKAGQYQLWMMEISRKIEHAEKWMDLVETTPNNLTQVEKEIIEDKLYDLQQEIKMFNEWENVT
jgi:hypothetical protein